MTSVEVVGRPETPGRELHAVYRQSTAMAAAGVHLAGSAWPDVVIGLLIAAMFGRSAVAVLQAARRELPVEPAK